MSWPRGSATSTFFARPTIRFRGRARAAPASKRAGRRGALLLEVIETEQRARGDRREEARVGRSDAEGSARAAAAGHVQAIAHEVEGVERDPQGQHDAGTGGNAWASLKAPRMDRLRSKTHSPRPRAAGLRLPGAPIPAIRVTRVIASSSRAAGNPRKSREAIPVRGSARACKAGPGGVVHQQRTPPAGTGTGTRRVEEHAFLRSARPT